MTTSDSTGADSTLKSVDAPRGDGVAVCRLGGDWRNSVEAVEAVRAGVLRDIEERDGLRLREALFAKLAADIRSSGEFRNLARDELHRPVRNVYIGLAAAGIGIYGLIYSMLNATAESRVKVAMESSRLEMNHAQESISDARIHAITDCNSEIQKAIVQMQDLATRVKDSLEKAREDNITRVRNEADNAIRTTKERFEEVTNGITKMTSTTLEQVSKEQNRALREIKDQGDLQVERLKYLSSGKAPPVGEQTKPDERQTGSDVSLQAMELADSRDFGALVEAARKHAAAHRADEVIMVLTPVIAHPSAFGAQDRQAAVEFLCDKAVMSHQQRFQNANNLIIAAVIEGVDDDYDFAVRVLDDEQVLQRLAPDVVTRLARGVHDKESAEELKKALDKMPADSLTLAGLMRALSLMKISGFADEATQKQYESALIRTVREGKTLDGVADYALAYTTASALVRKTAFDRQGVREALKVIREGQLGDKGNKAKDPWELGKLVDDFIQGK